VKAAVQGPGVEEEEEEVQEDVEEEEEEERCLGACFLWIS